MLSSSLQNPPIKKKKSKTPEAELILSFTLSGKGFKMGTSLTFINMHAKKTLVNYIYYNIN